MELTINEIQKKIGTLPVTSSEEILTQLQVATTQLEKRYLQDADKIDREDLFDFEIKKDQRKYLTDCLQYLFQFAQETEIGMHEIFEDMLTEIEMDTDS